MFGTLNLANIIFRSSLCSIKNSRNISVYTYPLYFRATEILLGEPLKKKKKLDPAIIRAKEERKKKKLQKRIRSLEKHKDHMKPIFEIDTLAETLQNDKRPCHLTSLSEEEIERRRLLEREWIKYKQNQWLKDLQVIKSMVTSQKTALKELKAVSKQLYKKAIEFDDLYLPYDVTGPVHTPPIENYDSPDGEYIETTIKYAGE
ncbi:39S ribosomal protein L40, mitochondrial [Apis mellifera caucasica]|uniref:Large ribosomal subunit protein mL40 n=1 Tax=Apis mellifera TaxID=7460 RepID=A0A7M7LKS3_APIME|nr:39S ribosomal protein L40, mitochondrial [Apis mellifera]XP_026296406.1 39S ribosomal protein L40, mitochondrial [Apis mellifera]KAG6804154.1 39S ribosomal protein L40, mitochondrial [Apis mellifera caucasica]KAG9433688.1 39S ribosomal protein L40, mitochondrial [Apis mellifera carnica]|eukprot:XP_001122727.1 39S ribosomal protein L40, mitochondrial [Apis mellifera]